MWAVIVAALASALAGALGSAGLSAEPDAPEPLPDCAAEEDFCCAEADGTVALVATDSVSSFREFFSDTALDTKI